MRDRETIVVFLTDLFVLVALHEECLTRAVLILFSLHCLVLQSSRSEELQSGTRLIEVFARCSRLKPAIASEPVQKIRSGERDHFEANSLHMCFPANFSSNLAAEQGSKHAPLA